MLKKTVADDIHLLKYRSNIGFISFRFFDHLSVH